MLKNLSLKKSKPGQDRSNKLSRTLMPSYSVYRARDRNDHRPARDISRQRIRPSLLTILPFLLPTADSTHQNPLSLTSPPHPYFDIKTLLALRLVCRSTCLSISTISLFHTLYFKPQLMQSIAIKKYPFEIEDWFRNHLQAIGGFCRVLVIRFEEGDEEEDDTSISHLLPQRGKRFVEEEEEQEEDGDQVITDFLQDIYRIEEEKPRVYKKWHLRHLKMSLQASVRPPYAQDAAEGGTPISLTSQPSPNPSQINGPAIARTLLHTNHNSGGSARIRTTMWTNLFLHLPSLAILYLQIPQLALPSASPSYQIALSIPYKPPEPYFTRPLPSSIVSLRISLETLPRPLICLTTLYLSLVDPFPLLFLRWAGAAAFTHSEARAGRFWKQIKTLDVTIEAWREGWEMEGQLVVHDWLRGFESAIENITWAWRGLEPDVVGENALALGEGRNRFSPPELQFSALRELTLKRCLVTRAWLGAFLRAVVVGRQGKDPRRSAAENAPQTWRRVTVEAGRIIGDVDELGEGVRQWCKWQGSNYENETWYFWRRGDEEWETRLKLEKNEELAMPSAVEHGYYPHQAWTKCANGIPDNRAGSTSDNNSSDDEDVIFNRHMSLLAPRPPVVSQPNPRRDPNLRAFDSRKRASYKRSPSHGDNSNNQQKKTPTKNTLAMVKRIAVHGNSLNPALLTSNDDNDDARSWTSSDLRHERDLQQSHPAPPPLTRATLLAEGYRNELAGANPFADDDEPTHTHPATRHYPASALHSSYSPSAYSGSGSIAPDYVVSPAESERGGAESLIDDFLAALHVESARGPSVLVVSVQEQEEGGTEATEGAEVQQQPVASMLRRWAAPWRHHQGS